MKVDRRARFINATLVLGLSGLVLTLSAAQAAAGEEAGIGAQAAAEEEAGIGAQPAKGEEASIKEEEASTGEQAAAEESQGVLPIPNYEGDFWTRSHLTGDWGGKRTSLAEMGIQFDVDYVTWVDTVVDGGSSNDAQFGGNPMYNLKIDLMRAGILPGAMIQVRAESRYGSSGMLNTGQITPNNSAALSPTNYDDYDDGFDIALTQLSWLQMLGPHFGVIIGKLDLYAQGAPSEFAGGRGRTQFMNWNLNFSTPAIFVPASTVGAGVVILPNENLTITSLLLSGTECTRSNCFDDLDEKGGITATTVSWQHDFLDRPGGVNGSFIYYFDSDFTELGSTVIGGGGTVDLSHQTNLNPGASLVRSGSIFSSRGSTKGRSICRTGYRSWRGLGSSAPSASPTRTRIPGGPVSPLAWAVVASFPAGRMICSALAGSTTISLPTCSSRISATKKTMPGWKPSTTCSSRRR